MLPAPRQPPAPRTGPKGIGTRCTRLATAAPAAPTAAPGCPGSTTEPQLAAAGRVQGRDRGLPPCSPHPSSVPGPASSRPSPSRAPRRPVPWKPSGTGELKPSWLHVAAAGRAGVGPAAGNQLCLLCTPEPGPGAESRRQLPREPGHLVQAPVGPRCRAAPAPPTQGCRRKPQHGHHGAQHPPAGPVTRHRDPRDWQRWSEAGGAARPRCPAWPVAPTRTTAGMAAP